MDKAEILSIIELVLHSYVLSEEEKLRWLFALPKISDQESLVFKNVLLQEKACMTGIFPENLSQEQIDAMKPLVEELKKINFIFEKDLRIRKESKSVKADDIKTDVLLQAANLLQD